MNLSKEEFLEKAKRDYPVGTRFKCAWSNNLPKEDWAYCDKVFKVSGSPYIPDNEVSVLATLETGNAFLYDCTSRQWAEILPEEQPKVEVSESEGIYRAFLTNPYAEFNAVYEKYRSEYNAVLDYALQEKHKEISRLTEQLKESKAYREKVEDEAKAFCEWFVSEKHQESIVKKQLNSGMRYKNIIEQSYNQFKQIK